MKMNTNGVLRGAGALTAALLLAIGMLSAFAPANAASNQGATAARSQESSPVLARRTNFGAIALNVNDGWSGWAYDKATKAKAKKAAVRHCKSRSDTAGCRTVLWVRNGCGAIAVRVKGGEIVKYRGAIAFTKKAAVRKAKKKVGSGAKLHTYVCTTRYR
ncbi:DUF4189 domain-containing protein [Nocardioides sp. Bht2]|uniref:DUF4189 domain-containing protein n=1 Tax=Nocardioides sp. Bht2 TaxID=3392297 RepID=UPI0039B64507